MLKRPVGMIVLSVNVYMFSSLFYLRLKIICMNEFSNKAIYINAQIIRKKYLENIGIKTGNL